MWMNRDTNLSGLESGETSNNGGGSLTAGETSRLERMLGAAGVIAPRERNLKVVIEAIDAELAGLMLAKRKKDVEEEEELDDEEEEEDDDVEDDEEDEDDEFDDEDEFEEEFDDDELDDDDDDIFYDDDDDE